MKFLLSLVALASAFLCSCSKEKPAEIDDVAEKAMGAVPVRVTPDGMTRGGKPYFVQGVGGGASMEELAALGANSVRTWTTNGLGETLDEAHSLGLTVSAGIWLEYEIGWFSYENPEHCDKQAERIRKVVMEHKDHPALLAWGIGNEVEGKGTFAPFWRQIDRLAKMIREIDPHHPTFTAIAGLNDEKLMGLVEHAPDIDFIGINAYGAAPNTAKALAAAGWTRPWMLTEWGPRGFWESKRTPYNSPIEPTSGEKANMMRKVHETTIRPGGGCLGAYAFVWGWKFESTSTWFGLRTHEGETIASVDVLEEMWTGKPPANRAPDVEPIRGVPTYAPVAPGAVFKVESAATDPDGDPIAWHWELLPEKLGHANNSNEIKPDPIPDAVSGANGSQAEVTAPNKTGVYRLYLHVRDDKGHAATANAPFEVR